MLLPARAWDRTAQAPLGATSAPTNRSTPAIEKVPHARLVLGSEGAAAYLSPAPGQGAREVLSSGIAGVVVGRHARSGGSGCVRGRPGLLRHSTLVWLRAGGMMFDGVFRQMVMRPLILS